VFGTAARRTRNPRTAKSFALFDIVGDLSIRVG
jgi:hypothetical protein